MIVSYDRESDTLLISDLMPGQITVAHSESEYEYEGMNVKVDSWSRTTIEIKGASKRGVIDASAIALKLNLSVGELREKIFHCLPFAVLT